MIKNEVKMIASNLRFNNDSINKLFMLKIRQVEGGEYVFK
jgi:hypothetical protein